MCLDIGMWETLIPSVLRVARWMELGAARAPLPVTSPGALDSLKYGQGGALSPGHPLQQQLLSAPLLIKDKEAAQLLEQLLFQVPEFMLVVVS